VHKYWTIVKSGMMDDPISYVALFTGCLSSVLNLNQPIFILFVSFIEALSHI